MKLETRGAVAIAWLDRPPANSISPEVVHALRRLWDAVTGAGTVRALVIASANPMLFCAGADIKAFTTMDAAAGKELLDDMHGLLREIETSPRRDDRRRQRDGARRRLRAGDGVRPPDRRRVGDVRPARDQPRDHPRASAARSGCRGSSARARALELNLTGDPIAAEEAYELGLANRVVRRRRAVRHRAGVGAQALRAGAARGRADQARVGRRRHRRGDRRARRRRSSTCSPPRTRARGSRRSCRSASQPGSAASERRTDRPPPPGSRA